jgi:hypothetical protein
LFIAAFPPRPGDNADAILERCPSNVHPVRGCCGDASHCGHQRTADRNREQKKAGRIAAAGIGAVIAPAVTGALPHAYCIPFPIA